MSSRVKRASMGSTYSSSKKRRNRDASQSSGTQSDSENDKSDRKNKSKSNGKSKRDSDQSEDDRNPAEDEDDSDDDKEYEVEVIKEHRFKNKEIQYLVGWKDWSSAHDTWEPLENLDGALDLVKQYRLEHGLDLKPKSGPRASDVSAKSSSSKKAKEVDSDQSDEDTQATRKRKRSSPHKSNSTVAPLRKNGINGPTKADKDSVRNREILPSDSEGSAADSMDDDEWHAKHKKYSSWESLIRSVRTIEKPSGEDGMADVINVCLLWKTGRTTWVPNKIARAKLPHKLLDFYEDHLQFTAADE